MGSRGFSFWGSGSWTQEHELSESGVKGLQGVRGARVKDHGLVPGLYKVDISSVASRTTTLSKFYLVPRIPPPALLLLFLYSIKLLDEIPVQSLKTEGLWTPCCRRRHSPSLKNAAYRVNPKP